MIKRFKKKGAFCLLFVFLLFALPMNSLVFAGSLDLNEETDPLLLENFEITGGLTKEVESTFDTARVITGTAERDTQIAIRIYRFDEDDEPVELYFYEITVGASGMFTQLAELAVGENIIDIIAQNGDRVSMKTAVVKRKKLEIKRELEQGAGIFEIGSPALH